MKNTTFNILYRMVEQAIDIIRKESGEITVTHKPAYPGKTEVDFCTNADLKAQAHYVEEIRRNFPGYGIIGEEEGLHLPCTIPNENLFFIVDPLDGTKAYKRGQSHGIGTMIALVDDNQVIASFVGNVNTGEIIGFGPETKVIRMRFDHFSDLDGNPREKLNDAYILVDKAPWIYPEAMQKLIKNPTRGGLFKSIRILGGSIGTTVACLWAGDVEAVVMEPAITPWDHAPIMGINNALGLVHLRLNPDGKLERYEPTMFTQIRPLPHRLEIVTREEHADKIIEAYNN